MRRFTKICLLASLFLIIMGGTLCALGAWAGGWKLAKEAAEEEDSWVRFAWSIPAAYGWHSWGDWESFEDKEEWEDYEDYGEWEELEELERLEELGEAEAARANRQWAGQDYVDTGIRASQVKKMKIEIGGAMLYLLESENDSFGIKVDGEGDYEVYEDNGTLYLEGNRGEDWEDWALGIGEEQVCLYLPKGLALKKAEIEVGGGMMEIAALKADEVDMAVGAGKITARMLDCKKLDVEVGAGQVLLERVSAQKLDMEIGMGSAYVQGDMGQKIKVECGMGKAELALGGSETDYNYKISCDMGKINIGGKNYSSLAAESKVDNGAAVECELECSMGKIEVQFAQ